MQNRSFRGGRGGARGAAGVRTAAAEDPAREPRGSALCFDTGRLSLQRVGVGAPVRLMPVAADEFAHPNGIARLTLMRDAAGVVTAVDYCEDGAGAVQRKERSQGLAAALTANAGRSRMCPICRYAVPVSR